MVFIGHELGKQRKVLEIMRRGRIGNFWENLFDFSPVVPEVDGSFL